MLAAALAVLCIGASHAAPPAPTAPAPDFVLKALDGRNHRLSEYRGEPVVLTFWASWCGPCRESLTALATVAQRTSTPALGVNLDNTADRAGSVADSLSLKFPTLVDARHGVARTYDVDRLPLTLLIDRDGAVVATWSGAPVDAVELARQIDLLHHQ